MREYSFWMYILASRSKTLYVGFTSDLGHRVMQHKEDVYDGFSRQYQCHRLVYFEEYGDVYEAIAREKQIKRWSRAKKITLIKRLNPHGLISAKSGASPPNHSPHSSHPRPSFEFVATTDRTAGLSTTRR